MSGAGAATLVLGGYQTDSARNWAREGYGLAELCTEATRGALEAAGVAATAIEVGHVGNFAAQLYCGQGHLGGLLVEADPAFVGLPTSCHEAACASGSAAVLRPLMADLEAGRYDVALVLGVEQMRTMPAFDAQRVLGAAAWVPREIDGTDYPWPKLFSELGDEYDRRYGLERAHLVALARSCFDNARRNQNAQTRGWTLSEDAFDENDVVNPVIHGRIRRQDCSQVTDGAVALVLASAHGAAKLGRDPERLARIAGWGHRTARMALADKLNGDHTEPYVFPQVRRTIEDAFARAAIPGVEAIDTIETHDCFTTTHYMAIDHFGPTPPGESRRAIEDGTVAFGGRCPTNPSGGLIGGGHPVGATGVRMLLDTVKQVTGTAGDYQVPGARRAATLNIGGSGTTTVCLIVEGPCGQGR